MAGPNDLGFTLRRITDELLPEYKGRIEKLSRDNVDLLRKIDLIGGDRETMQRELRDTQALLRDLKGKLDTDNSSQLRTRTIDDIPGWRTPQWYEVRVDFTNGDTRETFGTTEIDPTGPFIVTQVGAYWQCRDDTNGGGGAAAVNLTGRHMPITGYHAFVNQGGATAVGPGAGTILTNIEEFPELSLKISIAGSGRFWTGTNEIPGPAWLGTTYAYQTWMGWIDPSDRIQVYAVPEKAVPHTGRLRVVFNGFQVLNSIRMSQLMGFAG